MRILGENDRLPMGSTVATIGMFDGVHLGHATLVDFLKQRAAQAGKQSLVITFKHHPRKVLHPAEPFSLIMSLDDRLACLEELGPDLLLALDFTPELAALDSAQFIEFLRDRYGLGLYAPVSSTIVRGLIAAGRVVDAMHCMGRPYRLTGKVIHGFHNGKGLGFPTANVGELEPDLLLPHNGAYAVLAHVNGQTRMLNIGRRPTLNNGDRLSIEVNLFDFDGDVYGEEITLEFISFLRLEFKMCGLDELKHQLTLDRDNAKRLLKEYLTT